MAKLRMLDYLHRGVVYSCVGLSIYAITMAVLIHRDTMRRGQELMVERERLGLPTPIKKQETTEELEQSLAEQALAIFRKRGPL